MPPGLYLGKAGRTDISPLGELTSVEHLMVSWANELSDLSWLTADGSPAFPCGRCGGSCLMLTGRPASLLCPDCDAARIAGRVTDGRLHVLPSRVPPGRT